MQSFVTFRVPGLPPRKTGHSSVWRRTDEIPRLKMLRVAAHEASKGKGPIEEACEIRLLIFAHPKDGDLDSLVTGILDGLQAAHPRSYVDLADWMDVPVGVLPSQPVLLKDDRWIEKITAERLPPDETGRHYHVEIFLF